MGADFHQSVSLSPLFVKRIPHTGASYSYSPSSSLSSPSTSALHSAATAVGAGALRAVGGGGAAHFLAPTSVDELRQALVADLALHPKLQTAAPSNADHSSGAISRATPAACVAAYLAATEAPLMPFRRTAARSEPATTFAYNSVLAEPVFSMAGQYHSHGGVAVQAVEAPTSSSSGKSSNNSSTNSSNSNKRFTGNCSAATSATPAASMAPFSMLRDCRQVQHTVLRNLLLPQPDPICRICRSSCRCSSLCATGSDIGSMVGGGKPATGAGGRTSETSEVMTGTTRCQCGGLVCPLQSVSPLRDVLLGRGQNTLANSSLHASQLSASADLSTAAMMASSFVPGCSPLYRAYSASRE